MDALINHVLQFVNLSEDTVDGLRKNLRRKELAKGEYLYTQGRICGHLYFLENGCVRGFYAQDEKEITYWFAFENNFVTSFYSFITQQPGIENIQALEDCTLWAITYADLQDLYKKLVEIERLGRIIQERYYVMLEERFMRNHFKEARERYENLMTNAPHILQRVPLTYVASYLGITQETLSRVRSKA